MTGCAIELSKQIHMFGLALIARMGFLQQINPIDTDRKPVNYQKVEFQPNILKGKESVFEMQIQTTF